MAGLLLCVSLPCLSVCLLQLIVRKAGGKDVEEIAAVA
jgi:hypothetical protein